MNRETFIRNSIGQKLLAYKDLLGSAFTELAILTKYASYSELLDLNDLSLYLEYLEYAKSLHQKTRKPTKATHGETLPEIIQRLRVAHSTAQSVHTTLSQPSQGQSLTGNLHQTISLTTQDMQQMMSRLVGTLSATTDDTYIEDDTSEDIDETPEINITDDDIDEYDSEGDETESDYFNETPLAVEGDENESADENAEDYDTDYIEDESLEDGADTPDDLSYELSDDDSEDYVDDYPEDSDESLSELDDSLNSTSAPGTNYEFKESYDYEDESDTEGDETDYFDEPNPYDFDDDTDNDTDDPNYIDDESLDSDDYSYSFDDYTILDDESSEEEPDDLDSYADEDFDLDSALDDYDDSDEESDDPDYIDDEPLDVDDENLYDESDAADDPDYIDDDKLEDESDDPYIDDDDSDEESDDSDYIDDDDLEGESDDADDLDDPDYIDDDDLNDSDDSLDDESNGYIEDESLDEETDDLDSDYIEDESLDEDSDTSSNEPEYEFEDDEEDLDDDYIDESDVVPERFKGYTIKPGAMFTFADLMDFSEGQIRELVRNGLLIPPPENKEAPTKPPVVPNNFTQPFAQQQSAPAHTQSTSKQYRPFKNESVMKTVSMFDNLRKKTTSKASQFKSNLEQEVNTSKGKTAKQSLLAGKPQKATDWDNPDLSNLDGWN